MLTRGKVAAVLTPLTVAINLGSNGGLEVGDEGAIIDPVEVRDPDTKEPLGTVAVKRLNVEVVSVQDRVAVVRVASRYRSDKGTMLLKRITEDADFVDYRTVLVQVGDAVEIDTSLPF